jgi:diguanylate cyclase (GGDEF)-like protein
VSELNELRATHEELQSLHAAAQDELAELPDLRARLAELEETALQVDELQKEVHKLAARLDEAGGLAEKGERAEKLERKLEGALRRAEEAEERLEEERRLLGELRQTSERRIAELESRAAGASAGELDPETERMAFQDPMTGLPNRNILHKYLGFMLQQSVRYERYTALLRIDCDKFKVIGDTFGSEVGDRLIRLVGERLSAVVRSSDVLGRLGEDEFVILLSELTDQKEASVVTASVIKRIYHMLKKPFTIDEQTISVSVSIGVSLYPLDATNGEQMFQHSAEALKRAKESGRGHAQYYTAEVQSSHEAKLQRDHELKQGLERGEFVLLYQPIFDLSNGQIVGVEALIRWNHPRLGSIGPDEFLKVAEESGLIVLIGNWALRTALQRAAQWQAAGLALFVSLNLSRRQLLQADLIPTIHTALAEFRCSPDRVLLEISEELTGPELPRLRDTLFALQQLGVRLAVDNFGTSASSLLELRRGPFQVLKIDRRFVRGVPTQEEHAGIVMSALTLGHHLGRITVAVGVETEAEKAWLAKTGCRFAQGNLLSQPLPPEHIIDMMARR